MARSTFIYELCLLNFVEQPIYICIAKKIAAHFVKGVKYHQENQDLWQEKGVFCLDYGHALAVLQRLNPFMPVLSNKSRLFSEAPAGELRFTRGWEGGLFCLDYTCHLTQYHTLLTSVLARI